MDTNLVTQQELIALGYRPLTVRWRGSAYHHPTNGSCADFDVVGEVPPSPGLYAFTIDRGDQCEVRYVGMTTHLWMVTKGRLPGGGARGGQRYGRPRHAGVTRARVNAALTADHAEGLTVRQWVRAAVGGAGTKDSLREAEESEIRRWGLRSVGLNRG